ncbi:hypothetical protein CWI38_1967p0010 [Hamiltosporidium tvaerminnensis]|uniref:Uncharacterized protein n=1 Tax=Hamiltosporidium tvaerminnensis TaxID=1176355 RepID=A0A4Q9LRB7_9MICR|nr:hypothetical protein CWI38_1967p0010 [Hamiltosporidium tvaerminnensis]
MNDSNHKNYESDETNSYLQIQDELSKYYDKISINQPQKHEIQRYSDKYYKEPLSNHQKVIQSVPLEILPPELQKYYGYSISTQKPSTSFIIESDSSTSSKESSNTNSCIDNDYEEVELVDREDLNIESDENYYE